MLDLITDRTDIDVTNDTAKGQYNYTDWNRVESAVAELAGKLILAGYDIDVSTKTDWHAPTSTPDVQDTPTYADMERYRSNIAQIRAALAVLPTTPDVPENIRFLKHQGANDIEQILLDVEVLIDNMLAAYRYAGEIYAGE